MLRVALLAPLTVGVVWLGISVDGAVGIRVGIEENPHAREDVMCDGTRMTRRDCSLRRIAASDESIRGFLVQRSLPVLFGTFYLLAGLFGGLVGSWLRLAGMRSPVEDVRLEVLLVIVGAIAGIISCGLLIMSGVTTVSVWISQSSSELTALRRAFVVPLLAGLYTATFFEKAEEVLKSVLDSLSKENKKDATSY